MNLIIAHIILLYLDSFQCLKRACKEAEGELFIRKCNDRTRGSGFEVRENRFRLDVRKNFFSVRVVRHRNKLPREIMDASSLAVFKARLDGV